jgi:hypothetical protein
MATFQGQGQRSKSYYGKSRLSTMKNKEVVKIQFLRHDGTK